MSAERLTKQIGFKVEPSLDEKIIAIAKAERRTVGGLMRYLASKYVDHYSENEQAAARQ
jgi:hypothetical protein